MEHHAAPPRPDGALRSFGVEEELLLVGRGSNLPFAAAETVLAARTEQPTGAPGTASLSVGSELTFEVKQEQIEVVSPPVFRFSEIADTIRHGRELADSAAARAGAAVAALATFPFEVVPHMAPGKRFARMEKPFGITFRETLYCGFHVHVAVEDLEEGVGVLDRMRVWLPTVLALSANSPFWQGADTGFASYRYQGWGRWPTTGPSAIFGSAHAYRLRSASLLASGVPLDTKMLYFDARFAPRVPTVEIRVADVCLDPEHAATLAAVVRALVETAARQWRAGIPPDPATSDLLRVWMFQASRAGVSGELVKVATRRAVPAADAVAELLRHIRPVLEEAGEEREVAAGLAAILAQGTGANVQRAAFAQRGELLDVVAEAVRRTLA